MSYAYDQAVPVIYARPDERATFIRKTYLHLAGAILLFAGLEAAIFATFGVENILRFVAANMRGIAGPLIMMALFIGAGFIAQRWARSRTSMAMQYAGLGLYVLVEVIFFVPILAVATYFAKYDGLVPTAGILTLALFGGLTVSALVTRKDFSFLAPILSIGGFLMLGLCLIALVFPSFLQLGLWFSFLGVGLAAVSILYTTSNMIHHYSTDMYVAASLELFSAVAMMFYYILRILMQMRDSR